MADGLTYLITKEMIQGFSMDNSNINLMGLLGNGSITTRDKVLSFEILMMAAPQIDLPVKHHFSLGLYGRELLIPAGTILTGKIHKYPQMNILAQGKIAVLIDNEVKELEAPQVICSPAGTKRIAKAITDVVWITIHATEETDLDKIEDHFIAQNEQEYLEFCRQQKLLFEDK